MGVPQLVIVLLHLRTGTAVHVLFCLFTSIETLFVACHGLNFRKWAMTNNVRTSSSWLIRTAVFYFVICIYVAVSRTRQFLLNTWHLLLFLISDIQNVELSNLVRLIIRMRITPWTTNRFQVNRQSIRFHSDRMPIVACDRYRLGLSKAYGGRQ